MESNLNIEIKDYNGPLDVLLELVHKNKYDLKNLPITYLICHFNGFDLALNQLEMSKALLAKYSEDTYSLYKEAMRILRKVKYN